MKKYTKVIILSSVLLVLIILAVLAMIFDVDLLLFKNLSIAGIQQKKMSVEVLMSKELIETQSNVSAKSDLRESKNEYDVAKNAYENIDESTIEIVQEATKEEKYFIEYLWVVLGNYATLNKVDINIETPGSTTVVEDTTKGADDAQNQAQDSGMPEDDMDGMNQSTSSSDGITITIEGRYADVADFVFDVENDKSLRFKLDNIKMTYSGDNKIQATFKVLSLAVLK